MKYKYYGFISLDRKTTVNVMRVNTEHNVYDVYSIKRGDGWCPSDSLAAIMRGNINSYRIFDMTEDEAFLEMV
jgi:hypothetical protein